MIIKVAATEVNEKLYGTMQWLKDQLNSPEDEFSLFSHWPFSSHVLPDYA